MWDYCHMGMVPTSADPTSSQISLMRLKSPSTTKGADSGVITSSEWKSGEQLLASHLWFLISGYQRVVKCTRTKATPLPLPWQLGAEVGNLPVPTHYFPTGDSISPCTISSSHPLCHKWLVTMPGSSPRMTCGPIPSGNSAHSTVRAINPNQRMVQSNLQLDAS